MQKLILLSVILATFIIPAVLVRKPEVGNVYASVLARFIVVVAVYVVLLLVVYPRLF